MTTVVHAYELFDFKKDLIETLGQAWDKENPSEGCLERQREQFDEIESIASDKEYEMESELVEDLVGNGTAQVY